MTAVISEHLARDKNYHGASINTLYNNFGLSISLKDRTLSPCRKPKTFRITELTAVMQTASKYQWAGNIHRQLSNFVAEDNTGMTGGRYGQ